MCKNNASEVRAMLDRIGKINEIADFNPSVFIEEYTNLSTGEKRRYLPVSVRISMFRMKYPDGKIAVNAVPDGVGFVATARIYAHYKDGENEFLSEASAYREPMADKPSISAREWAQTTAIGIALRNAGFGLQFEAAKDDFPNPDMVPSKTSQDVSEIGDAEVNETQAEQKAVPPELTEEERYKQALATVCTIKKYEGRTLREVMSMDEKLIYWITEKYEGADKKMKDAAKVICEYAKKQAA